MQKTKVLQLFAFTGLGHYREALSIKRSLDAAGIENEIIDLLKWADEYSLFSKISVFPLKFFKWFFEYTTRHSSQMNNVKPDGRSLYFINIFFRFAEYLLGFSLRKFINDSDYTDVVAVHPWGIGALWGFGNGKKLKPQLYNYIPDEIEPGSSSFYKVGGKVDSPTHLVNSEYVKNLMVERGLSPERVIVVGHTLDPKILNNKEFTYKRVQDKLKDSKSVLTLGLYIGGTGTIQERKSITEIIEKLRNQIIENKVSVKIIPGPHLDFNDEVISTLKKLNLENRKNIEVFASKIREEVIEKGHDWIVDKIDIMFAKTGELIFYTMGSGVPMITFPPKGANEVFHLEYMMKNNLVIEYTSINDLFNLITNNRDELLRLSNNAYNFNYKLDGAEEIMKIVSESGLRNENS